MLKNILRVALVSIAFLFSPSAFAQGGAPRGAGGGFTTDVQDLLAGVDMQQMQLTLMNSIQQSGINIEKMFQEFADDSFDPANYQKELEVIQNSMAQFLQDAGVDLNKLQNTMQNGVLENLKIKLEATDPEWAILLPKLRKLIAVRDNLPNTSSSYLTLGMGLRISAQPQTPLRKSDATLKKLLNDPASSNAVISDKLKEYRTAYAQALKDIANAENDLADVLTPRQEAILVNLGFMK